MKRANLLECLSDNIVVDADKCVSCGICVDTCILDNLRLKLAPCRRACPLDINAQGYVQLIARGREEEAMEMLREKLPFPGILGRICSQPCEKACHRGQTDGQPVAVRALKRYLADMDAEKPARLPETEAPSGKKAAVIGSGPAGLMAAHDLAVKGHGVEIFEADPEPGGMPRWAIPEFRLPLDVLEREIDLLKQLGVKFHCGVFIGRDKTLEQMVDEFDAVIIAVGCPDSIPLEIEGSELRGVHYALPLLKKVRSGQKIDLGKKVVVIGGGNVALDQAETALRLGAEEVTMVCLESPEEVPAFQKELEEAQKRGVKLACSWGPVRIVGRDGSAAGIETRRCLSVMDENACFNPLFDDEESCRFEADSVIVAIGQQPDRAVFTGFSDNDGRPSQVNRLTLQSEHPKIFMAGDCLTGSSSVVEAMAQGRRAAESVDRLLKGEHLEYGRAYPGPVETDFPIDASRGAPWERVDLPFNPFGGAGDFREIEKALDMESARREAGRCHSCGGPFGKYRTCWFCLPCEVSCPEQALWVEVPYLLR